MSDERVMFEIDISPLSFSRSDFSESVGSPRRKTFQSEPGSDVTGQTKRRTVLFV